MQQTTFNPTSVETLPDSRRKEIKDRHVPNNVEKVKWNNLLFVRLIAKERRFIRVDFLYTIFDSCYFRKCTFEECNFTGCRFVATNLHGAMFSGCVFNYATFERTLVDETILDVGCPSAENMRMRFARSLRMNYQQVGDAKAANKAVKTELGAEETHLLKAWKSQESYYRRKYAGWERAAMLAKWTAFKILDFIWGNGESLLKLCRFMGVILILIFMLDTYNDTSARPYWQNVWRAPQIFFGVTAPAGMSSNWLTLIVFARLCTFGLFMAILVKRLNRR